MLCILHIFDKMGEDQGVHRRINRERGTRLRKMRKGEEIEEEKEKN